MMVTAYTKALEAKESTLKLSEMMDRLTAKLEKPKAKEIRLFRGGSDEQGH